MKKFSFLLVGVFLLGSITFVLADESNEAETATGATTKVTATETTTTEATDAAQTEVTTTETTTEATDVAQTQTLDAAQTEVTTTETTGTAEGVTTGTSETTEPEAVEDNSIKISDAAKEKYSEEQIAAYEWAFNNGITTINDIEKANLEGGLTRAQLAKMMSQYLTNVLGRTPSNTEEKANYADVDSSLGDLADFIETAYAYKIMGVKANGTPLENFNPKGQVTRAEYATVFSRVLYGDVYNKSEGKYYEDHIKALKEAGILANDDPSIKEIRGWVMLMMYRSVNPKVETPAEESTEPVMGMANPASVYCEEQGGTISIVEDAEGNQSGICKLADGTEVEEWEYYRANHTEETTPVEEAAPAETLAESN